jgi:hypothetical protein
MSQGERFNDKVDICSIGEVVAPRVMTVMRFLVPLVVAISATTGCASTHASPTVTVTSIVTVTQKATATATAAWAETDQIGVSPSPPFPTALVGWQLEAAWNEMPRVFTGTDWTALSGSDRSTFPSTMNGCNDQRFLVRWRAIGSSAQVAARWVYSAEAVPSPDVTGTAGKQVIANAGWMDVDGCNTPQFRLMSDSDGSTLADVTVEVQQLSPAP